MMELAETVDGMLSDNYKERFKAEFNQLGIRALKLWNMLENWKTLEFKPSCSKDMLAEQNDIQWMLIKILKRRAYIERIELDWDPEKERFNAVHERYAKRHAQQKKNA